MPFQRKEKNLEKLLLMSMTKYGLEENSDRQKYKLLQVQTTHVLATIHSSEIETKRSQQNHRCVGIPDCTNSPPHKHHKDPFQVWLHI